MFSAASPTDGICIPVGRRPSGAASAAASGIRGAGGTSGSSENQLSNQAPTPLIVPSPVGAARPPRPAPVPPRGTGGTRGGVGSGGSGAGGGRGVAGGDVGPVPGPGTPATGAASGPAPAISWPSGSRPTNSVVTPPSDSGTVSVLVDPRRDRTSTSHVRAGTVAYGVVEP